MFTGIIHAQAQIISIRATADGMVLSVTKPKGWKVKAGDSITVNGVCSTALKKSSILVFQYMPETLHKSNLGLLKKGEVVNLEQSLLATERLDGHIVQGHVDTIATISAIQEEGNSFEFVLKVPTGSMKFIAEKGAIAIDGISLTVVRVGKNFFSVKIIPYTREHTNLYQKKNGDTVNIEFDVVAKYVHQLLKNKLQ